jgi:hypothetical protein
MYHDGLHSGQLKRIINQQPVRSDGTDYNNLQHYSKRYVAEQWIYPALLEAQNDGGHGFVNPLEMKISIGSGLGRHRSVLVAEYAAKELRRLLRENRDNRIVQPVSVGTVHRDIDKKVPTVNVRCNDDDNHDDDKV